MARASRSDREGGRFDLHTANKKGGLAHLARALAWQARGDRFESDILHNINFKSINFIIYRLFLFLINHLLDKNTLIQNMSEKKITAENAKFFTLSFFIKKHKVHKAFY